MATENQDLFEQYAFDIGELSVERKKGKRYFLRLFILLFTISVAVPTFSAVWINSYGLFGEVKSSIILKEASEEFSDISSKMNIRKAVKGINVWNKWFWLWVMVVCLSLTICIYNLPKEDTIVSKKVRMDD